MELLACARRTSSEAVEAGSANPGPAALVDQFIRERLSALPDMVRLRGDAVPVDYELQNGEGVARIRLREGQAKRLRLDEVPPLDRPVRFHLNPKASALSAVAFP